MILIEVQCIGGGMRRWYLSTIGGRRGDCFIEVERGICIVEAVEVQVRENTFGGRKSNLLADMQQHLSDHCKG